MKRARENDSTRSWCKARDEALREQSEVATLRSAGVAKHVWEWVHQIHDTTWLRCWECNEIVPGWDTEHNCGCELGYIFSWYPMEYQRVKIVRDRNRKRLLRRKLCFD